jgi:hypothetical protein
MSVNLLELIQSSGGLALNELNMRSSETPKNSCAASRN